MFPGSAAVWLPVLALLAFSPVAAALDSDREQPIHIEADSVKIDDLNGVSVYTGNVIYSQGTIRLEADIVHLYYDENRKIRSLEALGEPARFRQRLEGDEKDMLANARRMQYFAHPERLVLDHDAYIWRQGVEFTGDFISYDADQDLVSATKESEDGRIRIVIPPQQAAPAQPAGEPDVR